MTTCYVGGSFDVFHAGHVNLLRAASKLAGRDGRVIVAVNSDAFHRAYRNADPHVGEKDRLAVVLACRYVTHAFVMPDAEHQRGIIHAWLPDYIVHSDQWMGDSLLKQLSIDQAFLDEHGIKMYYPPHTPGISSTMIRAML